VQGRAGRQAYQGRAGKQGRAVSQAGKQSSHAVSKGERIVR
jgi:hypothetical protein